MRNVFVIALLLLSVVSAPTHALEIPSALQDWQGWVLEKHPDIHCPFLHNNSQRHCVWPSELSIEANAQGATFSQRADVYRDTWLTLPGAHGFWPENLTVVSGNLTPDNLVVRDYQGVPQLFLPKGRYDIKGSIRWTPPMPRTLTIPADAGIVRLTLEGNALAWPTIENGNQLRLASTPTPVDTQHQDSIQVRVFRHINDSIPLQMTTQIQLDVSGKEREIQLGQALLDGFQPIALDSPLPARTEANGDLRLQLKPGSWTLQLVSHAIKPSQSLGYRANGNIWPQQEIWVFNAQPHLRSVQISGVPTLDPAQTQLPSQWQGLPAYLVTPDTQLQLDTLQRGASTSTPNQLRLHKDMWLDFDGAGFTVRDRIKGQLHQGWRLEARQPYQLQSAELDDGGPQLVTRLQDDANAGIEIRNRDIDVTGISRLERHHETPVSGWASDFNAVSTTLHLPPGWSLITATGASSESGSWMSAWRLWDVFLVLVISFTIGRITQPLGGLLAFAALVLTYQRFGAPLFIWLNIAAALALLPWVSGKFKHYLTRYTYLTFLFLGLLLLPFSVQQAREAFYPQQEYPFKNIGDQDPFNTSIATNDDAAFTEPAPMLSKHAESNYDASVEEVVVTSYKRSAPSNSPQELHQKLSQELAQAYDPGQQVQTGPGVPQWHWNSASLRWNGLIKPEENTRLYLTPPWINRIGNLLSLLLTWLLGGLLLRQLLQQTGVNSAQLHWPKRTAALPLLLVAALGMAPGDDAQASVSDALLQELEARLTKAPECLPSCASIESLNITAEGDRLSMQVIIHSAGTIALPLPTQAQQWWPHRVQVDGKPALLVQNANHELLVQLNPGRHQFDLQANAQGRDTINLNFALPLHNVSHHLNGWQLTGLPSPTQISSSLQLQRSEPSESQTKAEHLRPEPITPFVIVTRTLKLGLEWTLETQVTRVAPKHDAIHLHIPLLPGETPLSGDGVVITGDEPSQGKIAISLAADNNRLSWYSALKNQTSLSLQAPENVPWVEVWGLDAAPVWHVDIKGIAATQASADNNMPIWQPWPGEGIDLHISRPQAIQGDAIAIDEIKLHHSLGQRAHTNELNLTIRTHQAAHYDFALPDGATFNSLTIDDREQSLSPIQGILKIPLHPGEQRITLRWQSAQGIGLHSLTPALSLGRASSNQSILLTMPADRWPLLVGGPAIGPSVLLWGILAVVLLIAITLGRSQLTPLKTHQWVLLSLGIATVNLYVLAFIAVWLILLTKRGQMTQMPSAFVFKWMQVGLISLSIIALGALLGSISFGLLSSPDMHISGNGSSAYHLRWYQDQSANQFPQAWVISLPLWCYKVAMLLWSLWLASALLQWIRWSWQQLSHTALWYVPVTNSAANGETPEN